MNGRIRQFINSGAFQGSLMAGAMVVAGGFDALVSILSGRWLDKEQFGIFVAVTALLQVLVHATNVIRTVVAYYTAELYNTFRCAYEDPHFSAQKLALGVAVGNCSDDHHVVAQQCHCSFYAYRIGLALVCSQPGFADAFCSSRN